MMMVCDETTVLKQVQDEAKELGIRVEFDFANQPILYLPDGRDIGLPAERVLTYLRGYRDRDEQEPGREGLLK